MFQDRVDQIGPFAVLIDAIVRGIRSPYQQLRNIESFAVGRHSGDARDGTKIDATAELTRSFITAEVS